VSEVWKREKKIGEGRKKKEEERVERRKKRRG
jgi:hypothetical protein